jgi:hypothetical protein
MGLLRLLYAERGLAWKGTYNFLPFFNARLDLGNVASHVIVGVLLDFMLT